VGSPRCDQVRAAIACRAAGLIVGSYLYDWLLREALRCCALQGGDPRIERVLLGLSWSVIEAGGTGLCFSPTEAPRTLPWSGTLVGRRAVELIEWVRHWHPCDAAVGAATINALINHESTALYESQLLTGNAPGHLRVFEHFHAKVKNWRVVVVGRYPGLERLWADVDYQCLERRLQPNEKNNELPDTAADFVLPRADWVFITASSIANKTLPHLLALTTNARVVLMGPSLPWSFDWAEFDVNYLAGVDVVDRGKLFEIASEGGGTRIFDEAVHYRLLAL